MPDLNIIQDGIDRVTSNTRGFIIAEKPINKKSNIITKEKILSIDENIILKLINKINFENIIDKEKILNWLINNNFEIKKEIL